MFLNKADKNKRILISLRRYKMFLSKAELDYLTSKRQFSSDYAYTIKSRLQKKLEAFVREEFPLLVKQGYLTEFCKLLQPNLTENRKVF